MSQYKSGTDQAAGVIQAMLKPMQINAALTGQPTSLEPSAVRIVTGNDYDSEGLAIYFDVPALHDFGINEYGNAVQQVLLQIPAFGEHFSFRRNGVPGSVISKQITDILTPLGIDPTKYATWEGLNDKTQTPSIYSYEHKGVVSLNISPAIEKDDAQTNAAETPFKQIAHEVEAKHDAIMQSIVNQAAALKKENGEPIFTQEQLTTLSQETLTISDNESENWADINLQLGKLKDDEATAKKAKDDINQDDLTKSVISELPEEARKNLLFNAVLENAPSAYPQLVDAKRFQVDLEKAVAGKADLSSIFECSQFKDGGGGIIYVGGNKNRERYADVNTPDGADHPNTLKVDFDLPAGVKAVDVTRSILEFGAQKGLLNSSQPVMMGEQATIAIENAQNAAANNNVSQVENRGTLGAIKQAVGL